MVRTAEGLPEGTRVSEFITIGVVAKKIPERVVLRVLWEEDGLDASLGENGIGKGLFFGR